MRSFVAATGSWWRWDLSARETPGKAQFLSKILIINSYILAWLLQGTVSARNSISLCPLQWRDGEGGAPEPSAYDLVTSNGRVGPKVLSRGAGRRENARELGFHVFRRRAPLWISRIQRASIPVFADSFPAVAVKKKDLSRAMTGGKCASVSRDLVRDAQRRCPYEPPPAPMSPQIPPATAIAALTKPRSIRSPSR